MFEFRYRSDHSGDARAGQMVRAVRRSASGAVVDTAGHMPTPDEAKKRLDMLTEHGPTREAFKCNWWRSRRDAWIRCASQTCPAGDFR